MKIRTRETEEGPYLQLIPECNPCGLDSGIDDLDDLARIAEEIPNHIEISEGTLEDGIEFLIR